MTQHNRDTARFSAHGKELEFNRIESVVGNDAFDISSLLGQTGSVTYDPGFMNTATCRSEVTYIDGGAGILRYRGYPIEQLAKHSSFLEVAYLLIYGELPSLEALERFTARIKSNMLLHEDFKDFFTSFPAKGHPMTILQSAIAAMGTYYRNSLDKTDQSQVEDATTLLLAKMPTMVAYIYKRSIGLPLLYPDASKTYVEDFMRMTFGLPYQNVDIDPSLLRALDMLLILHADHEQNCSTSTVRLVGSANANIYSSISAGVGALSGPLHGGANEAVLTMLDQITGSDLTVEDFMRKVKNKEDGVRLMGFGHRVYKNYDPRAAIVKEAAHDVLNRLGKQDEMLDVAMGLEEIALSDDYFIERKLYPNVDFYTGLIYKAMGFPTSMFTPLFALGRLPGWIAQYREMGEDPSTKIGRPRQVYTGYDERDYVQMEDR